VNVSFTGYNRDWAWN